jgi:hypothetical protein
MSLNHPLVLLAGDCGQTVRQQVVASIARLNLDDLTTLAKALYIVNQKNFG